LRKQDTNGQENLLGNHGSNFCDYKVHKMIVSLMEMINKGKKSGSWPGRWLGVSPKALEDTNLPLFHGVLEIWWVGKTNFNCKKESRLSITLS
jgi:hypothetical protein